MAPISHRKTYFSLKLPDFVVSSSSMSALKLFLSATFILPTKLVFAMPAQIFLIRHAEKPTQGDEGSELSERGWQRARLLPNLFQNQPELARLGPPAALFAMAPQNDGGSIRAIQTLKYVAETFHLPIDSDFKRDDYQQMIRTLKKDPSLENKFVVICWERKVLSDIASELGVKHPPSLASEQYDRAWLLSFSEDGKLEEFHDFPQSLLPGDSQALGSF
jgi:phosphohistidine phosphatase SixA